MAYNYDAAKKAWESMNDQQKKQYTEQNKNDANFQQFAQQYHNENYSSSSSNQGVNSNVNQGQGTNTPPSNTDGSNFNNDNGSNGGFSNNNGGNNNGGNNNYGNQGGSPLSDGKNGNGNFYGNTQFDQEEQLDKSMFQQGTGVKVEQGTAKDTGRPDYQLESDARLAEMTNNLNTYWQTNPEYFSNRETFNKVFEYNQRESDAQRALLDSYWKKKKDMDTASNYNSGDSIYGGLNNAEITPDVFSLIKQMNPEAYQQYQKMLKDEQDKAIANLKFTGAEPLDVTLTNIINKLGIQPGDPHKIRQTFEDRLTELNVWQDSEQLRVLGNNITGLMSAMNNNAQSLSSQLEGRYSAGYIDARINKANANLQRQANTMLTSYSTLLQGRQQNIALAYQSAQVEQMQANEDQRIFDDKLKSLGFAMEYNSYRTPEQQAALRLEEQQIKNNMELLQKSQENDLALYNKYATAKLENQLEYELTDLNVSDPAQLRANLSRTLDQYYEQYGDIIQRPKQQVVEDVIKYAQENGISVAEALKKNFIEPLMDKPEYQQAVKSAYGLTPKTEFQKIGDTLVGITINPDGTYQIKNLGNYGDSPTTSGLGNKNSNVAGSQWSNGNQVKLGETAVDTGIPNVYGSNVKLAPTVGNMLQTAVDNLKAQGIDLQIGDSYRSFETQMNAYKEDQAKPADQRKGVAAPGKSFHEIGQAIDIAQSQMNDPKVIQALLDAGFTRPVASEKWHWSYGEGADAFGGKSSNQTVAYNENYGPYYAQFLDGYVPNGPAQEWLNKVGVDPDTILAEAKAWKQDHQRDNIQPMLNTIQSLMQNYDSTSAYLGSWGLSKIPGEGAYNDYMKNYDYLKTNLALEHLVDLKSQGATFGALSNQELNFISSSATKLDLGMSQDNYLDTLTDIYNEFLSSAGLPKTTKSAILGTTASTKNSKGGIVIPQYGEGTNLGLNQTYGNMRDSYQK